MRPDAVPLEERIEALKRGEGPLHVFQSELPTLAELFPEAFDPGWRRRMAAKSGTPWDFGRWLVIVSPDPPPVGPEERATRAEAERALRPLEEEVARAHARREAVEEELWHAKNALAATVAKANSAAIVTSSGSFTGAVDSEEIRKLRARVEELERAWESARRAEELAVQAYGTEANRWSARIQLARNRDAVARGELAGASLPLTDRVRRAVRRR